MPELPEIEVLRRSLEPRLAGRRIERVEARVPALREPLDRRRLRRLADRPILGLRRRGKYLLIDCGGGSTLVVHLGMSGRLTLVDDGEPREAHEHVEFFLAGGGRLRLRDPRRFGMVFVVKTVALERDKHFRSLGREPLGEPLTGLDLARLASGRRGPVKSFLMDANRLVGVGNIYASEALHRAGIHPGRSVARISAGRWERLAQSVVAVLEQAIDEGGTTLNDFTDGAGNDGYFQVSLAVYGREGEPCQRCAGRVRRIVQSGRSTFLCPRCQR